MTRGQASHSDAQGSLLPSSCRSCGAHVIWATVDRSGRRLPLDVEEVAPRPACAAYNARTGRCRILQTDDVPHVATWAQHGVTVHRAHFASCPHKDRWNATTGEP